MFASKVRRSAFIATILVTLATTTGAAPAPADAATSGADFGNNSSSVSVGMSVK